MHIKELIGKKYGFLTITRLAKSIDGLLHVFCKCECGIEGSYILENIERGKIISCGCIKDRNSLLFFKLFKRKLWSLIDIKGECWVWKGPKRKDLYFRPYVHYQNKQYNPIRWFAEEMGEEVHGNWAFITQCDTPCCVNPTHAVKVGLSNMKKAINKEIKGEYLRNKGI